MDRILQNLDQLELELARCESYLDHLFQVPGTSSDGDNEEPCIGPATKKGRKTYVERFPEIPEIVNEFLERHAIGAHPKRHTDVMLARNVVMREIAAHVNTALRKKYPTLDINVSETTIRRVGLAPHTGKRASQYYLNLVNFKPAPRKNERIDSPHELFHYSLAQIKFARECAAFFHSEVSMFSMDNKNKVPLDNTAVSQYFKPLGMHKTDLQPNDPDHSFPTEASENSKLTPEGFMELRVKPPRRARSCGKIEESRVFSSRRILPRRRQLSEPSPDHQPKHWDNVDKYGRPHFSYPGTGDLYLYLSAQCHYKATPCRHVNNMLHFLRRLLRSTGQTVFMGLVDGGPDWSFKSLTNIIMFGRLWQRLNLDAFILFCYAPKHSRHNPMERRWGNLSKLLTSLLLSSKLPGESISPWAQKHLTPEERQKKVDQVIDIALTRLVNIFKYEHYHGYRTIANKIVRNNPTDAYKIPEYEAISDFFSHICLSSVTKQSNAIADSLNIRDFSPNDEIIVERQSPQSGCPPLIVGQSRQRTTLENTAEPVMSPPSTPTTGTQLHSCTLICERLQSISKLDQLPRNASDCYFIGGAVDTSSNYTVSRYWYENKYCGKCLDPNIHNAEDAARLFLAKTTALLFSRRELATGTPDTIPTITNYNGVRTIKTPLCRQRMSALCREVYDRFPTVSPPNGGDNPSAKIKDWIKSLSRAQLARSSPNTKKLVKQPRK